MGPRPLFLASSRPLRARLGGALAVTSLLTGALLAAPAGCGARSALSDPDVPASVPPPPPVSNTFCASPSYPSGFTGLSIYLLLDKSGSMADDGKWDSVTAAIASFADDPKVAGIGMGMQYFPLSNDCGDAPYATPGVPIQLLPAGAGAIKTSLAKHQPDGGTPTLPALRGAIEYARASLVADPTRNVLIVLATDGNPDDCDSDVGNVSAAAAEGLAGTPQVLTAVIGIAFGNAPALAQIAAAGGAGPPIPIGSGPKAAQQFVDALRSLRDAALTCRFAVPATPGATPTATDISVTHTVTGSAPTTLSLVADASTCGLEGGFFVDDPTQPTAIILCPGACETAHASAGSQITVTAGCGKGSPPPGMPTGDGGTCGGAIDFQCVTSCGSPGAPTFPVCDGQDWVCPQGTVSTSFCTNCQAVPHGCCKPDGTLAEASCIQGVWTCPPGATLFGQDNCKPPAVCSATLPCPLDQLCVVPDASCGVTDVPGSCQPIPTTCSTEGPPVCACNGLVFPTACAAATSGVDVSANIACNVPTGMFACGPLFCRVADEICQTVDDFTKVIAPNSYACVPKTPGCQTGCGCNLCPPCTPVQMCNEACGTDPSGGATLKCSEF